MPTARTRTSGVLFADRQEAGRELAARLAGVVGEADAGLVTVLGLARGGLVVAAEVARTLGAPLGACVTQRMGVPGWSEIAFGAAAGGGVCELADWVVRALRIPRDVIRRERAAALAALPARTRSLGGGHPDVPIAGRIVIVVDDGIMSGASLLAAVAQVRGRSPGGAPAAIIVAAPVANRRALPELRRAADRVVVLHTPEPFEGVFQWYVDFSQVTTAEARRALAHGNGRPARPRATLTQRRAPRIDLRIPRGAKGLVLFAHGSGSGRTSPRNRAVARALRRGDPPLATALADLLTPSEAHTDRCSRRYRFDIDLLSHRMGLALEALAADRRTAHLPLGLFGASTGAAAACRVAARRPDVVRAIVSRGGRIDLAGAALRQVRCPMMLIVGGNDPEVLELNRKARGVLTGRSRLVTVPRAGHLFDEPGAIDRLGQLAADWFATHLAGAPAERSSRK